MTKKRIAEIKEWAKAYNDSGRLPPLDCGIKALKVIEELQREIAEKDDLILRLKNNGKELATERHEDNKLLCGKLTASEEENKQLKDRLDRINTKAWQAIENPHLDFEAESEDSEAYFNLLDFFLQTSKHNN